MSSGNTDQKSQTTIGAAEAWVLVLGAENRSGWASRFKLVLDLLRSGDLDAAIALDQSYSFVGMGSLSDIYAEDQPKFDRSWSAYKHAIRSLGQAQPINAANGYATRPRR